MKILEQTNETIITVCLKISKQELEIVFDTIVRLYATKFENIDVENFKYTLLAKSPSSEFEDFIQLLGKINGEK